MADANIDLQGGPGIDPRLHSVMGYHGSVGMDHHDSAVMQVDAHAHAQAHELSGNGSGGELILSNDDGNPRSRKGPRKAILVGVKKALCEQHLSNPSWSMEQLANWANDRFGVNLHKRTVFDILGDKDKWLAANPTNAGSKRLREAAYPELEDKLGLYVLNIKSQGGTIRTEELRTRALDLAKEMNIPKFTASNGWIHRFLKRKAVYPPPGLDAQFYVEPPRHPVEEPLALLSAEQKNTGSADESESPVAPSNEGALSFRERLQRSIMMVDASRDGLNKAKEQVRQAIMLLRLDASSVFNMDEAGLLFSALPSRSATPGSGPKRQMQRLTIALCCNATGSERLKPLVIGSMEHPPSFGSAFNPSPFVDYAANEFTLMTATIFNQWLLDLDNKMKQASRSIAMILDVASSHGVTIKGALHTELAGLKAVQLKAITLIYLPTISPQGASLPSVGQPLEQGIITMFKVRYRKQLMQWVLAQHHQRSAEGKTFEDLKPTLREALVWCASIWADLESSFLAKCWNGSGFLPAADVPRGAAAPAEDITQEIGYLQQLIDQFDLREEALDPVTYINMPGEDESFPRLSNDELMALCQAGTEAEDGTGTKEKAEEEASSASPVTFVEAEQHLEKLSRFAEENPSVFSPGAVFDLHRLRSSLQREIVKSLMAAAPPKY